MPAQTQAQSLSITINGTDYSRYLVELTIGFDSWQMGKGLLTKTGEISLTSISGGLNLDPRDNNDFAPGTTVTVSGHPLAGALLVLSPPTIEPLLSDIPATAGNIVTRVPVGCALAYYQANEPDDDESGVTLGTGTPAATVVRRLLAEAGITSIGSIATGVFEFEYPVQKQGGGFVDLAGEIMHNAGPMGYLYCDAANAVQSGILGLNSGSGITVTLGETDREYLPQLDGSIPPGVVQAVGIRRRVTTPAACTISRYEEPDVIKQRFEVCKYENAVLRLTLKDRQGISFFPILDNLFTNSSYFESVSTTQEYVTLYNSSGSVRGRYWKETGLETSWKIYGGDLLWIEASERYSVRRNISPDLVSQSRNPNSYGFVMEHSETRITRYKYRDQSIVAIEEEVWLPRVTIAPEDNTDPALTNAWHLVLAEQKRTDWSRAGETWTERVSQTKARGILNPDFVESDDEPGLTYYDMVTTPDAKTTISSTGNTVPPRAEYWQPLAYEEEDQLEAEAVFQGSKKRLVIQVPHAFTVAQMQAIAEAEGEIVWGRAYQYLVECDPTLFNSQQSPMPIVRVRGAGENRIFIADAIQWQHTPTEDWVAFAGIYLGGSGGSTTTVGSFSRTGSIAPITLVPTGGTAIDTTPTGNPRTPLPLDGLVMAGVTGYATLGVVNGLAVIE